MQLYLDSFGAFLAVRDGAFAVRTRANGVTTERRFATRQVQTILLTKGTALSADAALLAAGHDIPILLIDANTHFPQAQLSSGQPGSIAAVRRGQALFSRSSDGFIWVGQLIARKIAAQRSLLSDLAEVPDAPPGFAADVALTGRVLTALEKELSLWQPLSTDNWNQVRDDVAARFRGQEGTASRLYFQRLSQHLAGRLDFPGRQKRPAYDPFNTLLNYLYGMLYTQVHLALLKSGLDPHMGVLHADQYGARPTLAFDAIEPYRPWADAVAVRLVTGGQVTADFFDEQAESGALWLSAAGKDIVIEAMLAFLQGKTAYAGRQVRRSAQIDLDAQQLATLLKEYAGKG